MSFEFIENGSPTSAAGFLAAGVTAGFKRSGAPDFAMIFSEKPADFAGVFTSCTFAAAPVRLCRKRVLENDKLQTVIINSGNANACTGEPGMAAAVKSCDIAAGALNIAPEAVAVASTGRIGVQMNMALIEKGVALAVPALSADGGNTAAEAIMTTDTVPKAAAVKVAVGESLLEGRGLGSASQVGIQNDQIFIFCTQSSQGVTVAVAGCDLLNISHD